MVSYHFRCATSAERSRVQVGATWLPCVTAQEMKDGWPFGVALTGGGVKSPHGALAEDCCAERLRKRHPKEGVRWGSGRRAKAIHC
jgi:hypothetical protein